MRRRQRLLLWPKIELRIVMTSWIKIKIRSGGGCHHDPGANSQAPRAALEKQTTVGNYFVSNYPPFSFWKPEFVPDVSGGV